MRVIAGELKGRRLVAPRGMHTRPTLDRVKEALFSILCDVRDARVLDCFAGTGSLGIEALSRGAAHVTFIEPDRAALTALRRNLATLQLETVVRILPQRLERVLKAAPWEKDAFDLVFFDPPYAMIRDGSMARIAEVYQRALSRALAPHARIMVEHPSPEPAPPLPGLEFVETRPYGDTALTFYVRPPQGKMPSDHVG
jgi:16S rRNA (guanine966-N2)-methyltransferase